MANEIWKIISADLIQYFGSIDVAHEIAVLGDEKRSDTELLKAIFTLIDKVRRGQAR
jgi:hypothetical protein